jgi:hypothetical protein
MPILPNDGGGPFEPPNPPATGGGSGSGSGGSGGSSGGAGAPTPPLAQRNKGQSMGLYQVTRTAADRAESGPSVVVGPADVVTVTPVPTNTQNCFFSTFGATSARSGPNVTMAATANPRTVKVRNLNEIWVYSTVIGEGVYIDHQRS